jgi:hypothetical protein
MGLAEDEIRIVREASLLNDVGKVAIPDSILNKPAVLDEEEHKVRQHHVEVGSRMVASVKGLAHLSPSFAEERYAACSGRKEKQSSSRGDNERREGTVGQKRPTAASRLGIGENRTDE